MTTFAMNSKGVSEIFHHGFYGGIFWRIHRFAHKGDEHKGHLHRIDHATMLIKGGVDAYIEGVHTGTFYAPAVIEIDRNKLHKFVAVEDDTIYACVFATKDVEDTAGAGEDVPKMTKEEKMEFFKKHFCSDCDGCPKGV